MNMQVELAESRKLSLRDRAADYVNLTKPRILLLNLLTALGAMSMAAQGNWPSASIILATLAGLALAIGAGGALNCFIERDSDAKMERTADRPLPSGRMRPLEALIFGTILWIASYFLLYFCVNPTTAFLTMFAFGSYVGVYTPLKTRTSICTLVGAVPGALPPLIGWSAVRGHVDWGGFLLFSILFLWQIPHFLSLALLRSDEYARAGMPMLPVESSRGGGAETTRHQILLYTAALALVSLLPYGFLGAGRVYLCMAAVLGSVFLFLALIGHAGHGWTSAESARDGASRLSAARRSDAGWCKQFFYYSLLYLVLLFGTLVFDS